MVARLQHSFENEMDRIDRARRYNHFFGLDGFRSFVIPIQLADFVQEDW